MFLVLPEKPVFFREENKKFPSFYHLPNTSFEITGMFVPKLRQFRRFRCAHRVRFLSHTWQLPEVPLSNTLEDALIQQLVPRKACMNERVGWFLKFPQRWIWQRFGGVCLYNPRVWSAHLGFWFRFFSSFFFQSRFIFGAGKMKI